MAALLCHNLQVQVVEGGGTVGRLIYPAEYMRPESLALALEFPMHWADTPFAHEDVDLALHTQGICRITRSLPCQLRLYLALLHLKDR